tara:strand:- start:6793 stop:8004 length:1212 start_codon:yes stop_codon:yes gene_type:complete
MKVSWLISVTFATALSLLPFSVVYKPAAFGYLGASPGVLFLTIPLFLHFILVCVGHARWGNFSKLSLLLVGMGIFMSVLSGFLFDYQPLFLSKAVTLGILSVFWLSPFILSGYIKTNHILYGILVGLLICFAGILNDFFPSLLPTSMTSLIFGSGYSINESGRPRGFSSEASQFSAMLLRYLVIVFLLYSFNKKFSFLSFNIFIAILFGLAILIQSKGTFVGCLIGYAYALLLRKYVVLFLILMPIFILTLLPTLTDIFIYDLESFSSISTRATLVITVLFSMMLNPFGYGFYGFYPAISHFGKEVLLKSEGFLVNSGEIREIVTSMIALSSKSTLLDFLMLFGCFFIIILYRFSKLVDYKDPRSRFSLALLLLSGIYTSGHDSIILFTGMIVLLKFSERPSS